MDQAWVPSLGSVGQRHLPTKELTICSVVGWGLADSPGDHPTTCCPCKLRCVHALIVPPSVCKDLPWAWKLASPGPAGLSPPPHSCLEWKETGQGGGLLPGWMRVEDKGWHEALPEWGGIGEQRPEG